MQRPQLRALFFMYAHKMKRLLCSHPATLCSSHLKEIWMRLHQKITISCQCRQANLLSSNTAGAVPFCLFLHACMHMFVRIEGGKKIQNSICQLWPHWNLTRSKQKQSQDVIQQDISFSNFKRSRQDEIR